MASSSSSSSSTIILLVLLLFSTCLFTFALSGSIVTHLPGFNGPLPFHLETGYVNVDEENGVELFYYFVESERKPYEDPIILWLGGGPGCSVICALTMEVGPLKFRQVEYVGDLPKLKHAPYAWTKVSNIIFLDPAAGIGYSFAKKPGGYMAGDGIASRAAYKFLRKWFIDHPWFLDNPLYISGMSYGGKIAPVIAQEIADGNEAGQHPFLNLQGYLIGNPRTSDQNTDNAARVPYAHRMEILSDELFQLTGESCGGDFAVSANPLCNKNLQVVDKFLSEINLEYILDPHCPTGSPKPKDVLKEMNVELIGPPERPQVYCRSYPRYLAYFWANSNEVQEALHVQKGRVREWKRCNTDAWSEDIPSSIGYHKSVTSRGYRALVYSGDHDLTVPSMGTLEWIKSLNFSVVDEWRSWKVGGQVAGYTRSYANNMTFATVKGAGHTAPEYRPRECLEMFKRWISHKPL